jgi:putative SOS response-associated peptidase YedK
MCGRFALNDKVDEQIRHYVDAGNDFQQWTPAEWGKWEPSWNISPTDPAPFLFVQQRGEALHLRFESARWGLVPHWSKTAEVKYTFNARSEGLAGKPTWRTPLKRHRGVILANGYYEWQARAGQKRKTPFFIHDPAEDVIGFAALYSWWADPEKPADADDRWALTVTIITSDAIHTLAEIHDREPVILPRDLWAHWMDPTIVGTQALVDEAVAAGLAQAAELEPYEVSPFRVGDNGPQLVAPVDA